MIQAYSYVRFSTKLQSKGSSLERQLKASQEFCTLHNLQLSTKSFRDLGVSAFKNTNRPELEQMLEAIKEGEISKGSYILIEAIDRLSRKGISHTQTVLKDILSYGVNVAFVGEDAKTLQNTVLNQDSLNDLSTVILVALAADLAHKESLRKSKLIKASKAIARDNAKDGKKNKFHVGFWLKYNDDKKEYIFSERLDVVRLIVNDRLKGLGPRKIATHLNDLEIPSPLGKQWNHMTITKVITNPALYGAYQTTVMIDQKAVPDTLIEDYFPAVVNKDTFMLLQADSSKANKGKPSKANPFGGLLKCSCGHGMNFSVKYDKRKNGDAKEYQYHFCSASTEGRCKFKKKIRDLVPLLVEIMDKLEIKETPRKNIAKQEIISITEKIEQLNNMLLQLDKPPLSVLKTISELESKKEKLLKEPEQQSINQQDVKRLSSINDTFEYNQLLKRIVDRIIIHQYDTSYRVEVKKLDGHKQNFLIKNNKVLFKSDTKALTELLRSFKDVEDV